MPRKQSRMIRASFRRNRSAASNFISTGLSPAALFLSPAIHTALMLSPTKRKSPITAFIRLNCGKMTADARSSSQAMTRRLLSRARSG